MLLSLPYRLGHIEIEILKCFLCGLPVDKSRRLLGNVERSQLQRTESNFVIDIGSFFLDEIGKIAVQ